MNCAKTRFPKLALLLPFLLLSLWTTAQVKFETTMGTTGGDVSWHVLQDSDDNYVYAAWGDQHLEDILLVKTNPSGGLIWSKTFYTADQEVTDDIVETNNGYALAGMFTAFSASNPDMLLARIDSGGNLLWAKRYAVSASSNEGAQRIVYTSDGGFLITGSYAFNASTTYPILVKTDSLGNVEWQRLVMTGFGYGRLGDIIEIPGKKYLGVGTITGNADDVNVFCMDSTGIITWHRTYGGLAPDGGARISYDTTDHSMVIGGTSKSYGQGDNDILLFKADSSGNIVWTTFVGNSFSDVLYDMEKTWDGGYVFVGATQNSAGGADDMFIGKVDSAGNLQWMKYKPGSTLADIARNVVPCSDNGYLLTGNFNSYYQIFTAKFDYLGNTCSSWTAMNPGVVHTPLQLTVIGNAVSNPGMTVINQPMSVESTLTITPTCTACQNFSVTATSNSPVCQGGNLNLSSSGAPNTLWQGPASFTSTSASPTITNVTAANGGTYFLYANDGAGCFAVNTVEVVIDNCLDAPHFPGENNITVYPNPSAGTLFLENVTEGTVADVYSCDGKLAGTWTAQATGRLTLELGKLADGIYLLRVTQPDGTVTTKKIVLQH